MFTLDNEQVHNGIKDEKIKRSPLSRIMYSRQWWNFGNWKSKYVILLPWHWIEINSKSTIKVYHLL